MVVILKPTTSEERRHQLIDWLRSQKLGVHVSVGAYHTVLGLIGDTSQVDIDLSAVWRLWSRSSVFPTRSRAATGNFTRRTP